MRTPDPTASGDGFVVPMTLSKIARDSLKPTVFAFETLLPMTLSASLSASSPDTPVYSAFNRDIAFPPVYGFVGVTPTVTRFDTGATVPFVSVSVGVPLAKETDETTPLT